MSPLKHLFPYESLVNEPKRRAYLISALTAFEDRDAASSIRDLLTSKPAQPEIQLSALNYIRELFLFEAKPQVENILGWCDLRADVEISALVTLAVIAPDSPIMTSLLAELEKKQRMRQGQIVTYIAIATGLTKLGASQHLSSFAEVTRREALAAKVISMLIEQEYRLEVFGGGVRLVFRQAALENQGVPLDILLSHELSEVIGSVFHNAVKRRDLSTISKVIRRFAVRESLSSRWHFLPHVYYFAGAFILEGGQSVAFENTANGVWLVPRDKNIAVHWVDLAGVSRTGLLKAVDTVTYAEGIRISEAPSFLGTDRSSAVDAWVDA